MNKIEYTVVRGSVTQLDSIESRVRQMLADGWELNGELIAAKIDSATVIIQGMVRYNECKDQE